MRWLLSLFVLSFGIDHDVARDASRTIAAFKEPALYSGNWGLFQTNSTSHINAQSAWKYTKGTQNVVVAVVDTGLDIYHPDIRDHVFRNEGEKNCNDGIDEDKNGYVDDCYGVNLVEGGAGVEKKKFNAIPFDEHGHGTHIAGIIAGIGNRTSGTSGVAPGVKILPIKYYSAQASGAQNLSRSIEGIRYAVKMGATIINYSGGGPEFSNEEFLAIKEAESKGILFVAAAGNERSNTDIISNRFFPAAYNLSNIITATAVNPLLKILPSSNWGKTSVHVAAPGEGIKSTLPGGRYGTMTGTSQATAFVTGVAALTASVILDKSITLKSKIATLVKQCLLNSVNPIQTLAQFMVTGGIIDAEKSVLLGFKTAAKAMEIPKAPAPVLMASKGVSGPGPAPASTSPKTTSALETLLSISQQLKKK